MLKLLNRETWHGVRHTPQIAKPHNELLWPMPCKAVSVPVRQNDQPMINRINLRCKMTCSVKLQSFKETKAWNLMIPISAFQSRF